MPAHRHRSVPDPGAPVPLSAVLGPAAAVLAVLLLLALVASPGSFRVAVRTDEPAPAVAAEPSSVATAAGQAAPPRQDPVVADTSSADPPPSEQAVTVLEDLLRQRDGAVAARQAPVWAATAPDGLRLDDFTVLASLPVTAFGSVVVDDSLVPLGADGVPLTTGDLLSAATGWRARVETTYQLADTPPVVRTDTVTLQRSEPDGGATASAATGAAAGAPGDWTLTAWTPYPEAGEVGTTAPWELGPVTATVGERAVVLSWVDPADEAAAPRASSWGAQVAGWADEGAVTVDSYLGTGWPRTTLVLAPATVEQYAALVPGPPAATQDVFAAVTTDVQTPDGPGDAVVLNPSARDQLSEDTWQVTLTHELTHVASGARFGDGQEIWLAEGLADLVGWSTLVPGTVSRETVAARLLARVADGTVEPAELPDSDAFTDTDPDVVGDAYEGAWLAALMLEDELGTEGLLDLYADASTGDAPARERAERALLAATGEGRDAFEARWADGVRALAADR